MRQNDSDRTKTQIIKIDKIDSVQNSTNTVYNIDNLLCTGMLDCANLSMCYINNNWFDNNIKLFSPL